MIDTSQAGLKKANLVERELRPLIVNSLGEIEAPGSGQDRSPP